MRQLLFCALACILSSSQTFAADFCVLYRFFNKGTQETRVFAQGSVKLGDAVIGTSPPSRMLTLTLKADRQCLPGEWSILNESFYRLDCFGHPNYTFIASPGDVRFRVHVPTQSDDATKNGKVTVCFRIPFASTPSPEPVSFAFSVWCNRANPDCDVCPLPSNPQPFLRLNGCFDITVLDNIVLGPCPPAPHPTLSSPEDYFPIVEGLIPSVLPPLPYPCCQQMDANLMLPVGPRRQYLATPDPDDQVKLTPGGDLVRR
jgi:hypothetical protein